MKKLKEFLYEPKNYVSIVGSISIYLLVSVLIDAIRNTPKATILCVIDIWLAVINLLIIYFKPKK